MKYLRDNQVIVMLGKRVEQLRRKEKLTQKQLSFEAGISDVQLRRIEKGTINTGISTLAAIAGALEIDLKELVDF